MFILRWCFGVTIPVTPRNEQKSHFVILFHFSMLGFIIYMCRLHSTQWYSVKCEYSSQLTALLNKKKLCALCIKFELVNCMLYAFVLNNVLTIWMSNYTVVVSKLCDVYPNDKLWGPGYSVSGRSLSPLWSLPLYILLSIIEHIILPMANRYKLIILCTFSLNANRIKGQPHATQWDAMEPIKHHASNVSVVAWSVINIEYNV